MWVILVGQEKRGRIVSADEKDNKSVGIHGQQRSWAASEFLFIVGREDISLRSSWHDFEAGIAKCTGNDGPWRRYEWIYGMVAMGALGARRLLWPRWSAFSSSRYCCTVSRCTIYIYSETLRRAAIRERFSSRPLSSWSNRSCPCKRRQLGFVNTFQPLADELVSQKISEKIISFLFFIVDLVRE